MNILGFIPARGGSKGIKDKNIVQLAGKRLIDYTFDAAESSRYLTRIILSTDSERIARTADTRKLVEVFDRPKELAQDGTTTAEVISHLLLQLKQEEGYIPDYFVILQPTSPLRDTKDIDACLEILLKNQEVDSVVSVQEVPHNFIPEKLMLLKDGVLHSCVENEQEYTIRQKVPQYYARNGAAIYAFKTSVFLETNSYYGKRCCPYIMSAQKSVDVDTPFDLQLVRALLRNMNENSENEELLK